MIEYPDTTKGKGLIYVKGVWFAAYRRNGKAARKSLKTDSPSVATLRRNKFYKSLADQGASIYRGKTVKDKLVNKPDLYIYTRKPFIVQIKGKIIAECDTIEEAYAARDEHFKL
jgi:hypothetical protein